MKKRGLLFLIVCFFAALPLSFCFAGPDIVLSLPGVNTQARYIALSSCGSDCLIAVWVTEDGGDTWRARVFNTVTGELAWSQSDQYANVEPKALYLKECGGTCYLIEGYVDRDPSLIVNTWAGGINNPSPCRLRARNVSTGVVLYTADLTLDSTSSASQSWNSQLFVGEPACCNNNLYVPLWTLNGLAQGVITGESTWKLGLWSVTTNTMTLRETLYGAFATQPPQLICCDGNSIIVFQFDSKLYISSNSSPIIFSFATPRTYTGSLSTPIANNTSYYDTISCNDTCWIVAWEGGNLKLWSVDTTYDPTTPTAIAENGGNSLVSITGTPHAVKLFCCDSISGDAVGIVAAYTDGGNKYLKTWRYTKTGSTLEAIELVGPSNQSSLYVHSGDNISILATVSEGCSNNACGIATFDTVGNLSFWTNLDFTSGTALFTAASSAAQGAQMSTSEISRFGLLVEPCGAECQLVAMLPGSVFISSAPLSVFLAPPASTSCFCRIFNTACGRGLLSLAAQLYLHASVDQRACICTADPICAARVLLEVAPDILEPERLLPDLCCYSFTDNTTNMLTVLFNITDDQSLIARVTRELSDQGCCNVLTRVLANMTQAGPDKITTLCTVLNNLESYCSFCDIVSDWFYQILRDPAVAHDGASTLLANLLADDYCASASSVLSCLCCSFTERTGVDAAPVIADALSKLKELYNKTATLSNCF